MYAYAELPSSAGLKTFKLLRPFGHPCLGYVNACISKPQITHRPNVRIARGMHSQTISFEESIFLYTLA